MMHLRILDVGKALGKAVIKNMLLQYVPRLQLQNRR
jgi:hypothetical protein